MALSLFSGGKCGMDFYHPGEVKSALHQISIAHVKTQCCKLTQRFMAHIRPTRRFQISGGSIKIGVGMALLFDNNKRRGIKA